VSVSTLPEATPAELHTWPSQELAVMCRRQAVRDAVQQLVDGTPHLALATLHRSVRRCAHLDNRPLSAERVYARAERLVERMRGEAA
jgi:hypothetical protein